MATKVKTACRKCGAEVWTFFPQNPLCQEHKNEAMDAAIERARGGATLSEALRAFEEDGEE